MPTLEEDIYEILKVCRPDGYPEYKLRDETAHFYPVLQKIEQKETLLLYKFWTYYKETAASNWRTEFYKDKAAGNFSDKGLDFAYMVEDIKEIMDKIDEGLYKGLFNEAKLFVFACHRHLKAYGDLNLDSAVIIEYSSYVVASATAWASFRTTAQSVEKDDSVRQETLYRVMTDCGQTIYDNFRAILEEIKKRFGMTKWGTTVKMMTVAEIEQEAAELQAENERLRAEIAQMSAEGTQPVETNAIDKYFTLDRMAEVIKSDFNDADSALKTINIMRKMVDSDQDPAAAQTVLNKMNEVETFLKEKEKNKYGDYVNGNKIVNNHDGKESK